MVPRQKRIGFVACLAVAVCSIGVPLPALSDKHADELFPCAHCGCGCADAESCWRNCCCYTNLQKLVWARENDVTPPAFVIAAAKHEAEEASHGECYKLAATHAPACERCAHRQEQTCCEKPAAPVVKHTPRSFVLLISALRCHGLNASISWLPPSLPLRAAVREFFADRSERVCSIDSLYESPALLLASPPPDALLA